MRFIKKASFDNIMELSQIYKDYELYTDRDDFSEISITKNLEIIKEAYVKNGAIVTAVHCPSSKYKTSLDIQGEVSTNYMSWCEILTEKEELELFVLICKFIEEVAKVYISANDNSKVPKKNNEEDEENEENEENESLKEDTKIIVILHAGCIIGCDDTNKKFSCSYDWIGCKRCTDNKEKINISNLLIKIKEFKNLQIAFENITPFYNGKLGNNFGYGYENFLLAERLNQEYEISVFGVVVDFCHIFATCNLLEINIDRIEYFNKYMSGINDEQKKMINLFHLSKYNEITGMHGEIFNHTKEDQAIMLSIRDWCLKNSRNTPITLELIDSHDVVEGSNNFYKVMLEWSKLHILIKDRLEDDLYQFFESLYQIYALQFNNKTKARIVDIACKLRQVVLEKSNKESKLFGFNNEKQNLDIYLIQVQAYIYYMRYCNLAINLLEKYQDNAEVNITSVLSHYIFNDNLQEIRFDGLGSYYKIYWIKNKANLYRCYDGCNGGKKREKGFGEIIRKCFEHIDGKYEETQYLSFSKSFGRDMVKYYNPQINKQITKYNIEIIENAPINSVLVEDKWVTLQEYQDCQTDYINFSIDFSDFYNGRGDSGKEASLKELYEKVYSGKSWRDNVIGSIYDQEVILYNSNDLVIQRYFLNELEFIIMMVAYLIMLNWEDKKNTISMNSVIDKTYVSQSLLDDYFVKPYNKHSITICNIKKILQAVDFEYERKNKIKGNNNGFGDFAKVFIPWYESISTKLFYNEIINKLKNKGGEDDEPNRS
ncbi:MAG: hypothetical protein RSA29_15860 [Clostridium sp.]|uniref:hypothetical protein n=1 Tax=Clostridium sp. TaxID=1506 RepID=UPI003038B7BD